MLALLAGLVLFLGVHSTRIVADGWRSATIARIGALPWKAVYSVVSIASFALIVYGFGAAKQQPVALWVPPVFMGHVTQLLMLPVFVLFLAAYIPRNSIKAAVHHPQVISVKLWAFAHLLSNGNLADVLLFGGFLAWAVLDFRAARQRDRVNGTVYPKGTLAGTIACVVAGLAVYFVFIAGLHRWLFGVNLM